MGGGGGGTGCGQGGTVVDTHVYWGTAKFSLPGGPLGKKPWLSPFVSCRFLFLFFFYRFSCGLVRSRGGGEILRRGQK